MWRERAAVEFLFADNPVRVREVVRDAEYPTEAVVSELAAWGQTVLALPPVFRREVTDPTAHNVPTGRTGPHQLPELKYRDTHWCELVRLDLYDVQWHCRRCGLQSLNYTFAEESPPARCPRCDFSGYGAPGDGPPAAGQPLTEAEAAFVRKIEEACAKVGQRAKEQPGRSGQL
jgi:hypothetical protein